MSKCPFEISENLVLFSLEGFKVHTLKIKSQILRKNTLGDSPIRYNPVLIPEGEPPKGGFPVVLILAGFAGNGPKYFAPKVFEINGPQVLSQCLKAGEAPEAIYCFVDALTFWGGSQFINSSGTGNYEDYLVDEVVVGLKEKFPVHTKASRWCVAGGSSGGYGALHLSSKYPDLFGVAAAIAPDSFFEASLLPEIRKVAPYIKRIGGVKGVKAELLDGKLLSRKVSFDILNVIGMGTCYAPAQRGEIQIPIDDRGLLLKDIWKTWVKNDPIHFLKKRKSKIERLKSIYLDVGDRDQFHLQFGSRQIKDLLAPMKVKLHYSEFSGTHWDIGKRRPEMWRWLKRHWEG